MSAPWYRQYGAQRDKLRLARQRFEARCGELDVEVFRVVREQSHQLLVRAVQESNWQEGIRLSRDNTREMVSEALDKLPPLEGPHLDFEKFLRAHRADVTALKQDGSPVEHRAAFNLGRAKWILSIICDEILVRQQASLAKPLREVLNALPSRKGRDIEEMKASAERALAGFAESLQFPYGPLTRPVVGRELVDALCGLSYDALMNPLQQQYLHFLHRIVLMGLVPAASLGVFRHTAVNVGSDHLFPPPSAVPALMEEFRKSFPNILPNIGDKDEVMLAAKVSYDFVAIHPYADGNGRLSRLLMNLVLLPWKHPPLPLKAKNDGRHRYIYALQRADRGNLEPLAALIARSLADVYEEMTEALLKRRLD